MRCVVITGSSTGSLVAISAASELRGCVDIWIALWGAGSMRVGVQYRKGRWNRQWDLDNRLGLPRDARRRTGRGTNHGCVRGAGLVRTHRLDRRYIIASKIMVHRYLQRMALVRVEY